MSNFKDEQLDIEPNFGKKFKHTLDSDEEDDEVDAEKYNIMDNDEIEGAEKATVDFDGDIKITPFNMDEELETGHFDKEGMYIFKKEDNIRDNWLDNIDWGKVHSRDNATESETKNDGDNNTTQAEANTEEVYKQIIELVRPGETIQRAIQRFGKDCPKLARGQKRKIAAVNVDDLKAKSAKENIMKLTSIADQMLQMGDMDIYERKYEEFQLNLNKIEQNKQSAASSSDMFSDDFEVSSAQATSQELFQCSAVKWLFKWTDEEKAEVHGPHSSEEMLKWVEDGRFKDGVFVRRVDSNDVKFYSSKRIDFDLYI